MNNWGTEADDDDLEDEIANEKVGEEAVDKPEEKIQKTFDKKKFDVWRQGQYLVGVWRRRVMSTDRHSNWTLHYILAVTVCQEQQQQDQRRCVCYSRMAKPFTLIQVMLVQVWRIFTSWNACLVV